MFDWLVNAFRSLLGAGAAASAASVQAALNTIAQTFRVMYSYWHTVAGHVANGWQQLTRTLLWLTQYMQQYMLEQSFLDYRIVRVYIPWLAGWIAWLGGRVRNLINATIAMLRREYKAGDAAQHAYTRSVLLWVVVHVLLYLLKLILNLLHWIASQGATMWHYFTHLDAFAALLFWHIVKLLESLAWDVAKVLGKFFLALIVRHVVRFATLVETIVDAVL